jgi:hypothetical protein
MRALAFYIAHESQRKPAPEPPYRRAPDPEQSEGVEKLARRVVGGCMTVLMVLAAAVALPMPTGG